MGASADGVATRVPAAYRQPVSVVVAELGSDATRGLTSDDVEQRLRRDGPNRLRAAAAPSWFERVARQLVEPLVLLLLGALAVSLLAWRLEDESGWPIDAMVIAIILITNAALGALQEHRADRAVAELAEMTGRQAIVIRDGQPALIAVADIVVGDLLVIAEGDLIAADARVTRADTLRVAEAALTGESLPVVKAAAALEGEVNVADRVNMVHAGTAAVSGHGQAVVTATAMNTEVGQIAHMLSATKQVATPLEREISAVSRFLGTAVIAIAVVISVVVAMTSSIESFRDLVEVAIIAVAVAVAAVPEGLPAVLSLVLAIGVTRMARRNALVKRLASAETLGSATVICTDKTGTLTRNEMRVEVAVVASGRFDLTALADSVSSIDDCVRTGLVAAAAACNVPLGNAEDGANTDGGLVGDPTETSLVRAAADLALLDHVRTIERLGELPFDADRKRMSVLARGLDPTQPDVQLMVTKGAPDIVLDLCDNELAVDGVVALTKSRREYWKHATAQLASEAMRTLLVASRTVTDDTDLSLDDEANLTVLAVFGIMDPPRAEAAEAIATAQRAGIRVVMLTGDHPNTASSIATKLGIAASGERAVAAAEIDAASESDLIDLLAQNTVFARVTPAHKLRMVQALQSTGHVVAMTGDGVNDAPALKAADIGVAMGLSGTDVAREASDMVLTDDNFATIVEAVKSGRAIFTNVKSFLRYLLSSNVGEVLTIFLGVVFAGLFGIAGNGDNVVAPLTAVQILWINLLTDTGPALALGFDRAHVSSMHRRPRAPGEPVIDAPMQRGIGIVGLTMAIATLLMFDAKRPGGLIEGSSDVVMAQTAAFTVLVLAQLFNCFSARSDRLSAFRGWAANPLLLVAVLVSLGLQIAVVHVPILQRGFGTAALSVRDWLIAAVLASSVLVVSELRKVLERRGAPPNSLIVNHHEVAW